MSFLKTILRLGMVTLTALCAACGGAVEDASTIATQTALAGAPAVPTVIVQASTSVASVPTPGVEQVAPTSAPTNDMPVDDAGAPLVARVNGAPVTLEEFRRAVARLQLDPSLRENPDAVRAVVMQTLIEQQIIEQEASKAQIGVSTTEVDAEITRLVEASGSADTWNNWLAQNLYTEDEFRRLLYTSLLTNRMRDSITGALDGAVPHVHARHILVSTRDEANTLLVLLRNGQDFGALAADISLDVTSRPIGGDLGWFTQDELLESALADVAFNLQPGQIAGPIQTALGYHIIQTLEADVRPISDDKRAGLAQRRFETWLATQIASAAIEQYL